MRKSLVVACSENGVIGKQGRLPWHLPNDLKHFKALTHGHAVIMGRLTFLSIGRVLPGRLNIILSRNKHYKAVGAHVVSSLPEAFAYAARMGIEEAFVIGGSKVYEAALSYVDTIYLTSVHTTLEGDAFFCFEPGKVWQLVAREKHGVDPRHPHAYSFLTYARKR